MEIPGRISDILRQKSPDIYTIKSTGTVFEAVQLMVDKNVGALLVMKGKDLHGVVTERDYLRKVMVQGKSSKKISVDSIMTEKLICVSPDNSVTEALRLMTGERIRHLPVLEGKRIMGMVSIGDLVKWVISAQDSALSQMESYISGGYPG